MNKMNFVSKIVGVEFYPLSDDEVRARSSVIVTNKNQFTDKGPEPHGIYDSRMGTIYSKYSCATCEQGIRKCPGHFAVHELKYPI
jgi:DNA-directed RNA polymerase beta' subunit